MNGQENPGNTRSYPTNLSVSQVITPDRTIPAAVRREVIGRDGMACRLCGIAVVRLAAGLPYRPDSMHLYHVVQWGEGGANTVDNLLVSCADCNLRRPRPKVPIRSARVRAEWRQGAWWWVGQYRPPLGIESRFTMSVEGLGDRLNLSPIAVLRLVVGGSVGASGDNGPIQVQIPDWLVEDDRARERERRTAARQNNARGTGVHARGPDSRPTALSLQWEQMRSERIARERAAKVARRQEQP